MSNSGSFVSLVSDSATRLISSCSSLLSFSNSALVGELVFTNLNLLSRFNLTGNSLVAPTEAGSPQDTYSTGDVNLNSLESDSRAMLGEKSTDQRFMRFMNPVFKYDFKVGNYMPDDIKKMNPHLFNTIKDVTTGIRKSS